MGLKSHKENQTLRTTHFKIHYLHPYNELNGRIYRSLHLLISIL